MVGTTEKSSADVKVTVIVPVHNSEKYLQSCLDSALSQVFQGIEILCIDSSTTDLCFKMIRELQKKDGRIVYISNPNSSYGHKINIGIGLAKGKYIAILESDDLMDPTMIEKLYPIAEKYHTDVADSNFCEFFAYRGRNLCTNCNKISESSLYNCLIDNENTFPKQIAMNGIWTGLYRKNFLLKQGICLNESPGASYQDMSFIFLTGCLAKRVYHLKEPLYWYRVDNTCSSVKDDKKIYEIIDECKFLKEELKKRNIQNNNVWALYYVRKYSAFYWNYRRLSEKGRELFLERYLSELRADIEAGVFTGQAWDKIFYIQSLLLVDDLEAFKEYVAEADSHKSIGMLCETLDRIGEREIVVFGAGVIGNRVINILRQNENVLLSICDNAVSKHGTYLGGLEIRPVEETVKRFPDACYLVVNRKHSEEMKEQLLSEGIAEANIEVFS